MQFARGVGGSGSAAAAEAVFNELGLFVVTAPPFNATGDGVTASAAANVTAFQAAINAAQAVGGTVVVPNGTFALNATLNVTATCAIVMSPGTVLDFSTMPAGGALGQAVCIKVSGSEGAEVALTANLNPISGSVTYSQASTVTVGTTAAFSVQYVLIRSDAQYDAGASGSASLRGFIGRVKAKDATTLTLEAPTPFSLLTADNATVAPLTMVEDFKIRGGKIVGGGVGSVHNGIQLNYCARPVVEGVIIDDCEDSGVSTEYVVGALVSGGYISDSTSPTPIGNTGYGVVFGTGSRDCTVEHVEIRNCRHSFAGGGVLPVLSCYIHAVKSYDSIEASFDCHEPCYNFRYTHNVVRGCVGGFSIRGSGTYVGHNDIQGSASWGIRVKHFNTNTDGIRDVTLEHNQIDGCAGSGVQLEGQHDASTTVNVVRAKVLHNTIRNTKFQNISATGVKGADISHNDCDGVYDSSGTSGSAIRVASIAGSPALTDNEDVVLTKNVVRNPLRHGIWVKYTTNVEVETSNISGVPASPGTAITIENCENAKVDGGVCDGSSPATLTPVVITDTDHALVTRVTVYGNSGAGAQDGVRFLSTTGAHVGARAALNYCTGMGRSGINSSDVDRVIIALNDAEEAASANRLNLSGVSDWAIINGDSNHGARPVSTLTIAAGVVTASYDQHFIDTESAGATDDLDTINGVPAGKTITISAASSARTVVVKDGTGNLKLAGDFSMDNVEDRIVLQSNGTNLFEISRSDNGA